MNVVGAPVGLWNFARLALVLGLIAGCTPQPSTLPAASSVPTPTPTEAPDTVTPSRSGGLDLSWQPFERVGDILDMAHGGAGWVALADCGVVLCSPGVWIFFSPDLEVWDTIDLPRSDKVEPISVSANSDGYLVAAYAYADVGEYGTASLQLWRSTDGRSWEHAGKLDLGTCNIEDCPRVRGVGLAPTGAIAVGDARDGDDHPIDQSRVSEDGATWRSTTIADYSTGVELERVVLQGMESTPTDLFVFGHACGGLAPATCTTTVWSTIDGHYWAEEQSFNQNAGRLVIASNGVERVAGVTACASAFPVDCATDVWTGLNRRAWTNVAPGLDIAAHAVAWSGDAFVLIGERDGRFATYASPDGAAWSEVPSELGGPGGCGPVWLAGGTRTVTFGVPCGSIWMGTVEREG
jgi:hypothetical protein